MKFLFSIVFVIISFTILHPQQFSRLNGLEDSQGNTILLYSLGIDNSGRFSPVYNYNVDSKIEAKIMDAYSNVIDTSYTNSKTIGDYEFFPNDVNNFINVGLIFDAVTQGYAARNDTITYTDWGIFFVDISKQHPNQVYISDFHKVIRSFDGGYSYPADSTTDFEFLSLADFDDRVFFGTDNNRLIKSEDQGITFSIVDTSNIQTSMPGLAFYYDVNQYHIYRLNRSYNKFTLNVSNNKGNASTWTKTYERDTQFFITIDSTQSGVVYLADGRKIYKSVNNGYAFTEYKSLPSKLVGIYKKPNSEILYAASKYQLYEIKPDTTTTIKSIPIPAFILAYYPLAIGNKWVYNYKLITNIGNSHLATTFVRSKEVIGDTTAANGKLYYHLTEGNLHNLERIDTLDGKVFQYYEHPNLSEKEYVIADLIGEVGDTVITFNPSLPNYQSYLIMDSINMFNQFGLTKTRKNFIQLTDSVSRKFSLTEGLGMDFSHTTFIENLKYSEQELKGCVINGIVYGDTTLTEVNEKPNTIPAEFRLEQNYPNPFNPSTKIGWQLPVSSWVTLKIYDVLGREVSTLVDEYRNSGRYEVEFIVGQESFPAITSGIYFYRLKAGNFVETKKMILLR